MKVALVHDWITGMRGGEKCLEAFLDLYPNADIHTMVHVPGTTTDRIDEAVKASSWLQRVPAIRRVYRVCLPFYPQAIKSLDLSGYDLVVSLSHAAAKNVQVPAGTTHICYCFTPMRYIWDQVAAYFGMMRVPLWPVVQYLRRWDKAGSSGVDHFVAISHFIRARIRCFYQRQSFLIYPPVATGWVQEVLAKLPAVKGPKAKSPFLYAGALVPYKRPDLVVQAANMLRVPLVVAGGGPMMETLKAMAGPTVTIEGRVSDERMAELYATSRALLFPGKEDFGMVPVECLAAGTPVIGLRAGGLAETLDGLSCGETPLEAQVVTKCGVFIAPEDEGKVEALVKAIEYFTSVEHFFSKETCQARAALFSPQRFQECWQELLVSSGLSHLLPEFMLEGESCKKTAQTKGGC